MKGKIFSILFALVLVVSFSLVAAVPVSAASVSQPTVTVDPDTKGLIAQYTINFTTSSTGALAAGQYIYIDFTDYATNGGNVPVTGYSTGDVTVNGALVPGANVVDGGSTANDVKITSPVDIAASTSVEVIFELTASIKNPTTAGSYTLGVKTTSDDTDWKASVAYIIAGYTGKPVSLYNLYGVFVNSYDDITSALAVAGTTGWTITVASDYNSAVSETIPILVDAAKVTIESIDGADSTTVYASSGESQIFDVRATDVTIDGFTMKGDGATDTQNGLYVRKSGFNIKNNKFIDIIKDNIMVRSDDGAITSGTIDNNTLIGEGASALTERNGILVESYSSNAISGVDITNNTLSHFGTTLATSPDSTAINVAAEAGTVSDITITGNTVTDCYTGLCLWKNITGMTGLSNSIADNTFSGCRMGVQIMGATDTSTFNMVNNTITDNILYGIKESGTTLQGAQNIQYNDISGNGTWGIYNIFATSTNDPVAKHNWWGDATGPSGGTGTYASIATGSGDAVSKDVTYDYWLGASVSAADYATGISSLNAQATAGVKVASSQSTDIGVALYTGNPQGTPEFTAVEDGFFDVYLEDPTWTSGALVNIKLYADGVTSSSKAYFWNTTQGEWIECYEQGAASGYVWVNVRPYIATYPDRVPVLTDLTGTPFAIGTEVPAVTLSSIAATPASVSLDVDGTQQLTVTATYSDTSTADVTAEASYESSVTSVATVSTGGLITGVAEGDTTITVSYETAIDTVSVTVGFDPIVYDEDGDGAISKTEALTAVTDYFAGDITKAQALEVIALYFAS